MLANVGDGGGRCSGNSRSKCGGGNFSVVVCVAVVVVHVVVREVVVYNGGSRAAYSGSLYCDGGHNK